MSVWALLAPRRRRAAVMAAGAVVGAALACVGSLVYQGGTYAYFSDSVSVQVTITVAPGGKAASPQQAARASKVAGTPEAATSSGTAKPSATPSGASSGESRPATSGKQGGGSEDAAPAAPSPVVPAPSGAPEPPAPPPSLAPAPMLAPLPPAAPAPKLAPVPPAAPAPQLVPPAVRPDSLVAHVSMAPPAAAPVADVVSGLGG